MSQHRHTYLFLLWCTFISFFLSFHSLFPFITFLLSFCLFFPSVCLFLPFVLSFFLPFPSSCPRLFCVFPSFSSFLFWFFPLVISCVFSFFPLLLALLSFCSLLLLVIFSLCNKQATQSWPLVYRKGENPVAADAGPAQLLGGGLARPQAHPRGGQAWKVRPRWEDP